MPELPEYYVDLLGSLISLKASKPDERSEVARRFAVAITELEKVCAYVKVYIVDHDPNFLGVSEEVSQ